MADRDVKIQDLFMRLRELHARALNMISDANMRDVYEQALEKHYYTDLKKGKLEEDDILSGAIDVVLDQMGSANERQKKKLNELMAEIQACVLHPDFRDHVVTAFSKEQPSLEALREDNAESDLPRPLSQFLVQHGWNNGIHVNQLAQAYEQLCEDMQERGTVLNEDGAKRIDLKRYNDYSRMLVQGFIGAKPYTEKEEKLAQQLAVLTMDAQLQMVLDEIPEPDRRFIVKETGLSIAELALHLHHLHAANIELIQNGEALPYYQRWNEVFPDTLMGVSRDGSVLKERVLKQFAQRLDEAGLVGDVGRNWREEVTEIGYAVAKATVLEKEGANLRLQQENAELKLQIEALQRANTGLSRAERYLQEKNNRNGDLPSMP